MDDGTTSGVESGRKLANRIKELGGKSYESVSYTHLDVYKRQRLSCEVDSQKKHLILTNDKVKNGRVTKVQVEISEIVEEDEETKSKED